MPILKATNALAYYTRAEKAEKVFIWLNKKNKHTSLLCHSSNGWESFQLTKNWAVLKAINALAYFASMETAGRVVIE